MDEEVKYIPVEEETVRFNVDLPVGLYEQLRKEAFDKKVSMASIIRATLVDCL